MPSISNMLGHFFGCTRENAVVTSPPQSPPRARVPAQTVTHNPIQTTVQATVQAPKPVVREGYFNPRSEYTPYQLCQLAKERKYTAETLMQMLQEMNFRLSDPQLSRQERIDLAYQIAKLLPVDSESLFFLDGCRQPNFYASYAIDLIVKELIHGYNANQETMLKELIQLWIQDLVPAQENFNVDGVIYSRKEMTAMLHNAALFDRNKGPEDLNELREQADALLHGAGSRTQSVHEVAVNRINSEVLRRMAAKKASNQILELAECKAQINKSISSVESSLVNQASAKRGLEKVCSHATSKGQTSNPQTPHEILKVLWGYICNTTNDVTKLSLQESLIVRLMEIDREKPCFVGQCQRLLDVPTGIDEEMNILSQQKQVQEDISSIAAGVNNYFDLIVDEVQRYAEHHGSEVDAASIGELGKEILRTKVRSELGGFRGVDPNFVNAEIKRVEPAFDNLI